MVYANYIHICIFYIIHNDDDDDRDEINSILASIV